ncbi:MAG: glycosyltransferase family 1 protein [Acidobacteria bacterium]|nr:glycosyltransferase family 1 protein [Acidobacteriota bacterium]
MNVAVFTDNDFDKVNGVTTTLTAALQFAPPDVRMRVYTAAGIGEESPHYLALRSLGVPIPFYAEMRMYVPRLRRYLAHARADRVDLVHLTTPGPIGLAGLWVAERLGVPLVGSFHTDLAAYTHLLSGSPRLGALMREYMRWPYGRCAQVLAPSDATRRLLEGARGEGARVRVWPRGVDADLFAPARRSERLRERWHVSPARPALLYVGRVSREKGLDLLPLIQQALHSARLEHRFIVVGQGPLLPELQRRMPDAVFTGVLSRPAVAEAFASADLFVFPSRTDTAGNVVLEAQASGLPVVVSGDGGPCENMRDGETGVVCRGEGSEAWADAVGRLVADRLRRRRMGVAARAYAESRRWQEALQPLYRTYRELVAVRGHAVASASLEVAPGGRT